MATYRIVQTVRVRAFLARRRFRRSDFRRDIIRGYNRACTVMGCLGSIIAAWYVLHGVAVLAAMHPTYHP